jgi:hypothetical protein
MTTKTRTPRPLPFAVPLAAATVIALGAGAGPAQAKTSWGIADQKAETFSNPAFAELQDAGMTMGRYVLRYDAFRYKKTRGRQFYAQEADAWLQAAEQTGVRPLITFSTTASTSRSLRKRISAARYLTEFRRFRKAYPEVRDFSLANEPNLSGPYKNDPEALGRLYRLIRHELRGCSTCRLLAGDLHLTDGAVAGAYALRVRRAAGTPIRIWGLNNYNDVNDRTSVQTKAFLRSSAVRGAKVWITESGGVYSRKLASEQQNPFLAQRRGAGSDSSRENYQYDATRFLNRIVQDHSRQIQRAYIYQLQSEPNSRWKRGTRNHSWDSGLLDPRGETRKSYGYVLRHVL